MQNYLLIMYFI